MDVAAKKDKEALIKGKPGLNKLRMLSEVRRELQSRHFQNTFLEYDVLGVIKRWLEPTADGHLPNATVRSTIYELLAP